MQHRIRVNFILNVAGMVLPLATALVTVPIYISHIGPARYGILAVVWILLGYFGFLDFGLSRASANALSRLVQAGPAERTPVLVTSLYLNAALGAAGGVALYFAFSTLMRHFGRLPLELTGEVEASLVWIATMLPVALVSGVGSGAIESRELFLISNLLTTFGGVLGQVAPVVCALLIGPSLSVVIPAALLARLVSTLVIWACVLKLEHPVDIRRFDGRKVRELLGYGAWVSVTSIISPILESLDQLLIGLRLGPAAIAHYSVPMSISQRSAMIAAALSKTLFPRLSRLPKAEATMLAERATVTLAFGFAALCGPAIILAGPALRLWVGADFAAFSTPVAEILMFGAWANGIASIPYSFLQGQGRPDITAKVHAAEIVPFIGALWLLMGYFGLPGAALAWTLRTGLDGLVLMHIAFGCRGRMLRALPTVALMAACWTLARWAPMSLLEALGLALAAELAVVAAGLMFDQGVRSLLLALVPRRARGAMPRRVA